MKKQLLLLTVIALFLALAFSCTNSAEDKDGAKFDSLVKKTQLATIPPEVLNEILNSVPSPVEMTSLIQSSGAPYNESLLNPTSKVTSYTTNYKKSLNLGIYGTDMGYLNMYEKTVTSLSYLESIGDLADDLKVGQFFDFATMKRLASNKQNIDSIIYITTSSFDKLNKYLANQNRGHISALLLIGGWVEALHLACQISEEFPSEDMNLRIGEQKDALSQIMLVLKVYNSNPLFKPLVADFEDLKKAYDGVTITYTKGEPNAYVNENGMLVVEDNTESHVSITPEQVKTIISTVEKIRNNIIQ